MTVLKLEVFVLKLEFAKDPIPVTQDKPARAHLMIWLFFGFAKIKKKQTQISETALLSVYVVRLCHISPYLRNQTKPLLPLYLYVTLAFPVK